MWAPAFTTLLMEAPASSASLYASVALIVILNSPVSWVLLLPHLTNEETEAHVGHLSKPESWETAEQRLSESRPVTSTSLLSAGVKVEGRSAGRGKGPHTSVGRAENSVCVCVGWGNWASGSLMPLR